MPASSEEAWLGALQLEPVRRLLLEFVLARCNGAPKTLSQWMSTVLLIKFHWRRLMLLHGCGLNNNQGVVPYQTSVSTQHRILAGSYATILVIHALEHGFLVTINTHVLNGGCELELYLSEHPQRMKQVLLIGVNKLKGAGTPRWIGEACVQGTHAKYVFVEWPSQQVAATLAGFEATASLEARGCAARREIVQAAAAAAPGRLIAVLSGSDNFNSLSTIKPLAENAELRFARVGQEDAAQLTLRDWRSKLVTPLLPAVTKLEHPALLAEQLAGRRVRPASFVYELDGIKLKPSRAGAQFAYAGVQLSSGVTGSGNSWEREGQWHFRVRTGIYHRESGNHEDVSYYQSEDFPSDIEAARARAVYMNERHIAEDAEDRDE